MAEITSKRAHKECMHPDAGHGSCKSKIIDAHTIQKNGSLKSISDKSNHVFCFGVGRNGKAVISKLGWQKASTFKGFCAKHDKEMFSPIEDTLYVGSKEQSFIAGYRAVALEYFKKISVVKSMPSMSKNIDRGMILEDQINIQNCLQLQKQGFLKGIDYFKETLNIYSRNYKLQNYKGFESLSVYFSGNLGLAVSGCFAPDFTIDGKRIQSLAPGVKFVENIAINTLNTENGHALVFSWPSNFKKCTKFVDPLIGINHKDITSILTELIFSYIENTYFSMDCFNDLEDHEKSMIESMARKSNQYGEPINFSGKRYTNWEVSRIVRN